MELSWDAVSGADGYEVRYRESGGSWGSWSDVGSVTEYTVSGLNRNTAYEFEVQTVIGTARSEAASDSRCEDRRSRCRALSRKVGMDATRKSVDHQEVTAKSVVSRSVSMRSPG